MPEALQHSLCCVFQTSDNNDLKNLILLIKIPLRENSSYENSALCLSNHLALSLQAQGTSDVTMALLLRVRCVSMPSNVWRGSLGSPISEGMILSLTLVWRNDALATARRADVRNWGASRLLAPRLGVCQRFLPAAPFTSLGMHACGNIHVLVSSNPCCLTCVRACVRARVRARVRVCVRVRVRVRVQFAATGLDNKDGMFGKSDPFATVVRREKSGTWIEIFRTEVVMSFSLLFPLYFCNDSTNAIRFKSLCRVTLVRGRR